MLERDLLVLHAHTQLDTTTKKKLSMHAKAWKSLEVAADLTRMQVQVYVVSIIFSPNDSLLRRRLTSHQSKP